MASQPEATEAKKTRIWEALRRVIDPELHVNIVDLGLVYDVEWKDDGEIHVEMTLTTPGCPVGGVIMQAVGKVLQPIPGVTGVHVNLTFEPRWTPDRITLEGRRQLAAR